MPRRKYTPLTPDSLLPETRISGIMRKLPDGAVVVMRLQNQASAGLHSMRKYGMEVSARTVTIVDRQTGDAVKATLYRKVSGGPRKQEGYAPRARVMRVIKRMLAGETNQQIVDAESISMRNVRLSREAAIEAGLIKE